MFSFAIKMQQLVSFALLKSYKIFLTAVSYKSTAYCECVLVCILALVILHSKHILSALYNISICGLCGCTNFFFTLSHNGQNFQKTLRTIYLCGLKTRY